MTLIQTLTELSGASGNEHTVRRFILREIQKYARGVQVDKFGNILVRQKGDGALVMLAAHMDEIGLMVRAISENGMIACSSIGGLVPVSLVGRTVRIPAGKGDIHGVVTLPDISEGDEVKTVPAVNDVIVDTGYGKVDLIKKGVEIGSFIEFEQRTGLIQDGRLVIGKALDDRVGCYILMELARRLKGKKANVAYVFTVQEEMGLYGAKTSMYTMDPDWAIAVDVTAADDTKEHPYEPTRCLGRGPSVTIKDAEMLGNVSLVALLKKVAKKHRIPLQLDVSDFGTTDALSISISKGGIPATAVGVPVRNLHTAFGIASMNDIDNTVRLLAALVQELETRPSTKSKVMVGRGMPVIVGTKKRKTQGKKQKRRK